MASSETSGRRTAITVVLLAVAVLAIFAAMNSYQVSARYAEQFPDTYGITRAKTRLSPIMAQIPADARLGYITDLQISDGSYSAIFIAAQYALAPRQLVTSDANPPDWALGNFTKQVDYAAAGASKGYAVTADFGGGVVLYRRK